MYYDGYKYANYGWINNSKVNSKIRKIKYNKEEFDNDSYNWIYKLDRKEYLPRKWF